MSEQPFELSEDGHLGAVPRKGAASGRPTYVSKSDLVTDGLRQLITDGRLSPGTALRQRELAEQFGVSYTPVREAFRRLESEGLVEVDIHRGARVARTESEQLAENYRILAALESLAGVLAMSKVTDDDLAEIKALYHQVAACRAGQPALTELNRRFHFRLYECARSPMLLVLLRQLWRSFPAGPQAGRPHPESVHQHAELLDALERRDEKRVAEVISEHVLGSIEYLPGGTPDGRAPARRNRTTTRSRRRGD